jgi:pyridoxal phosphate enzyme (YggS family)
MAVNQSNYEKIERAAKEKNAVLVAVSKTKPASDIQALYDMGHRDFGENYVQELVDKQAQLPADIRWHFIGHLQSNKVKYIAPFVHLIHGVDSGKLLKEINKQGVKHGRVIPVLLQIHIAQEETKFGLDESEFDAVLREMDAQPGAFANVQISGLMGMASFSDDKDQVRKEFQFLKGLFDAHKQSQIPTIKLETLSMGMSGDYEMALEEGSTMIRVGSLLFGARERSE